MQQSNSDFDTLAKLAVDELLSTASSTSAPFNFGSADTKSALALNEDDHHPSGTIRAIIEILSTSRLNVRSPFCTAHMVQEPMDVGVIGEFIETYFNQCAFIWEEAPIAKDLEDAVSSWFKRQFCFPSNWQSLFTSGGTISNLLAILAARDSAKSCSGKPVILCSEMAHLSISKVCRVLGLDGDAIINVPFEAPTSFEKAFSEISNSLKSSNYAPMAVVSTYGQTGTGQIEDLSFHRYLAEKFGCWLHVDAAWGGCRLLMDGEDSPFHDDILAADSISWDPHKSIGAGYPAGIVFMSSSGLDRSSTSCHATYALREDSLSHDVGYLHFEGSRPLSAIKLWMILHTMGAKALAAQIRHKYEVAKEISELIRKRDDFHVYGIPETAIVCFRPKQSTTLDKLGVDRLRHELFRRGKPYLSTTTISGESYFRLVVSNTKTDQSHASIILDDITKIGTELIENKGDQYAAQ